MPLSRLPRLPLRLPYRLRPNYRTAHTRSPPTTATVALLHHQPPKHAPPTSHLSAAADIAWALHSLRDPGITVAAPVRDPLPAKASDWTFPDTEQGILAALSCGANTLWAQTPLSPSHPLATLSIPPSTIVVGQPPHIAGTYADKSIANMLLKKAGLALPKTWVLRRDDERSVVRLAQIVCDLPYPVILKPTCRGEGRAILVRNIVGMFEAVDEAHGDVIIEEFLEGAEGCVTVLPSLEPGVEGVALPVVLRGGQFSVAPTDVAESTSSVVTPGGEIQDPWFDIAKEECLRAVEVLGLTTIARVDFRRKIKEDQGQGEMEAGSDGEGRFYVFSVNLVPDLSGSGRLESGRPSLCARAAEGMGWDYPTFVKNILQTGRPIKELMALQPNTEFDRVDAMDFHVYNAWGGGKG